MTRTIGVGIIGAGPVTQAIHLPTLAKLEDFKVMHIMDIDESTASQVAAFVGAKYSTDVESVVNDPDVDVIAICSPAQFHVPQVLQAIAAGKKAILCEKPFASTPEEALELQAAATSAGIPIVVGAMHAMDPGWLDALEEWNRRGEKAKNIRVTVVLPPNSVYETVASEMINQSPIPHFSLTTAADRANLLRGGVLGLAVHTVPVLRHFITEGIEVLSARTVTPFGYEIVARSGATTIEFFAVMQGTSLSDWRMTVQGDYAQLTVQFPPSYVHAGSANSTFLDGETSLQLHKHVDNGYVAEWLKISSYLNGETQSASELQGFIDDLDLTLSLAQGAYSVALKDGKN